MCSFTKKNLYKKKKNVRIEKKRERESPVRTLFPPQNPNNYHLETLNLTWQGNVLSFLFVSYVPEISFLSYSFVMFRIDFLLSIWVNFHIYIDILFVALVFGLKFIIIIFILYMADEASLFFGEILKLQPMSSSSGHGNFFFFFWVYYI